MAKIYPVRPLPQAVPLREIRGPQAVPLNLGPVMQLEQQRMQRRQQEMQAEQHEEQMKLAELDRKLQERRLDLMEKTAPLEIESLKLQNKNTKQLMKQREQQMRIDLWNTLKKSFMPGIGGSSSSSGTQGDGTTYGGIIPFTRYQERLAARERAFQQEFLALGDEFLAGEGIDQSELDRLSNDYKRFVSSSEYQGAKRASQRIDELRQSDDVDQTALRLALHKASQIDKPLSESEAAMSLFNPNALTSISPEEDLETVFDDFRMQSQTKVLRDPETGQKIGYAIQEGKIIPNADELSEYYYNYLDRKYSGNLLWEFQKEQGNIKPWIESVAAYQADSGIPVDKYMEGSPVFIPENVNNVNWFDLENSGPSSKTSQEERNTKESALNDYGLNPDAPRGKLPSVGQNEVSTDEAYEIQEERIHRAESELKLTEERFAKTHVKGRWSPETGFVEDPNGDWFVVEDWNNKGNPVISMVNGRPEKALPSEINDRLETINELKTKVEQEKAKRDRWISRYTGVGKSLFDVDSKEDLVMGFDYQGPDPNVMSTIEVDGKEIPTDLEKAATLMFNDNPDIVRNPGEFFSKKLDKDDPIYKQNNKLAKFYRTMARHEVSGISRVPGKKIKWKVENPEALKNSISNAPKYIRPYLEDLIEKGPGATITEEEIDNKLTEQITLRRDVLALSKLYPGSDFNRFYKDLLRNDFETMTTVNTEEKGALSGIINAVASSAQVVNMFLSPETAVDISTWAASEPVQLLDRTPGLKKDVIEAKEDYSEYLQSIFVEGAQTGDVIPFTTSSTEDYVDSRHVLHRLDDLDQVYRDFKMYNMNKGGEQITSKKGRKGILWNYVRDVDDEYQLFEQANVHGEVVGFYEQDGKYMVYLRPYIAREKNSGELATADVETGRKYQVKEYVKDADGNNINLGVYVPKIDEKIKESLFGTSEDVYNYIDSKIRNAERAGTATFDLPGTDQGIIIKHHYGPRSDEKGREPGTYSLFIQNAEGDYTKKQTVSAQNKSGLIEYLSKHAREGFNIKNQYTERFSSALSNFERDFAIGTWYAESSDGKDIENPRSSAAGDYQFLWETWKEPINKYVKDYVEGYNSISRSEFESDRELQREFFEHTIKNNYMPKLRSITGSLTEDKLPVRVGDSLDDPNPIVLGTDRFSELAYMYMIHHLGGGGAKKFILQGELHPRTIGKVIKYNKEDAGINVNDSDEEKIRKAKNYLLNNLKTGLLRFRQRLQSR